MDCTPASDKHTLLSNKCTLPVCVRGAIHIVEWQRAFVAQETHAK